MREVLSDLYAMGVTECDNMLMLLGISNKVTAKERDVVVPLMLQGFKDSAADAGTSVQGGQNVVNPWLTIDGVATSVCQPGEYIMPDSALPGDVLILTKPLGTQVAVSAHQWLEQPERWSKLKLIVSAEDVEKGYLRAMSSMARLNRGGQCRALTAAAAGRTGEALQQAGHSYVLAVHLGTLSLAFQPLALCTNTTLTERRTSPASGYSATRATSHGCRRTRSASSSTICPS